MKQRIFTLLVMFITVIGARSADALTLLQENLIDMPNRFALAIVDFAADGEFTPQSVRALAEKQLQSSGFKLVPEESAPPLATIQVTVMRRDDPIEGKLYMLDVNVYNASTINTTYRLRKGTIWMVGSEKVVAGGDFPKDVEKKVSRLLRYLVQDYFTANPNEVGKQ